MADLKTLHFHQPHPGRKITILGADADPVLAPGTAALPKSLVPAPDPVMPPAMTDAIRPESASAPPAEESRFEGPSGGAAPQEAPKTPERKKGATGRKWLIAVLVAAALGLAGNPWLIAVLGRRYLPSVMEQPDRAEFPPKAPIAADPLDGANGPGPFARPEPAIAEPSEDETLPPLAVAEPFMPKAKEAYDRLRKKLESEALLPHEAILERIRDRALALTQADPWYLKLMEIHAGRRLALLGEIRGLYLPHPSFPNETAEERSRRVEAHAAIKKQEWRDWSADFRKEAERVAEACYRRALQEDQAAWKKMIEDFREAESAWRQGGR